MNFPHFIAKRIAFSKSKSFTKVIVNIAIAAISLSLATMIITTLIIGGFKKEISTKVFGFHGHIHITDINVNRSFEEIPIDKSASYLDSIEDIGQLEYQTPASFLGFEIEGKYEMKESVGGVEHIQPFVFANGLLATKKEFFAIRLKGVDSTYNWNYIPDFIKEGAPLEYGEDPSNGIVVSSVTANALELKIGQRIRVTTLQNEEQVKKVFKVQGIYNTGLEEYDRLFALIDMRRAQDLVNWDENEISGVEVFLDDIDDLDIINQYLYEDVVPGRIYTETIRTKFPSIFEWLKLQDINEDLLLWLMIVVAIINMITALLILILERTQMIGIFKALGSTDWQIRKVFLYNAAYIILFGLLIGNILGLGIGYLQHKTHFITLDEASYYLSYAPVLFDWSAILLINLFCFILTISFLVLPTFLITRINPIDSIRFD